MPNSPTATGRDCGAWDCGQQDRFNLASEYLRSVPGYVGIVVRDRQTGAVWEAGDPARRIWAGSTPKLALAIALLELQRAGTLALDATATKQIGLMLSVSDNDAANALWRRYVAGKEDTMMVRFQTVYGMANAGYVGGFPKRWGFVKCSAHDLASLMDYILDRADPSDRDYLVHAMRTVGDVQKWGVWGAGAANEPGVKDGWSIEKDDGKDHWITATVGFTGPNQRYVVAAMYHQLPGGDTIERGVQVLTDLVALAFGQPVPAPVTIPPDY
jgi:hypothetical protein